MICLFEFILIKNASLHSLHETVTSSECVQEGFGLRQDKQALLQESRALLEQGRVVRQIGWNGEGNLNKMSNYLMAWLMLDRVSKINQYYY